MKTGPIISIIGHAIILTWGMLSLPGAKPYEVESVDAMPVDLVPIADLSQISEGKKTAPKKEKASTAKVTNPVPRPDSQKAGKAPVDQDAPATDKTTDTAATPQPSTSTPPPPVKAPTPPEPVKDKAPPAPEPTKAEPTPPPEPSPVKEAPPPTTDVGEIAPKPDKPVEDVKPVTADARPRTKPKPPTPVKSVEPKPVEDKPVKKDDPKKTEFDPDQVAALLNKVDPSGGGGKSSPDDASLGSSRKTGQVKAMSQTELDALRARIQQCWNPPVGATSADALVVPIRMELNIDGTLNGDPVAISVPGGDFGQVMAESALRAVRRCAPYDFLPPDKFETWRTVNINFDPRDMF